MLSIEECKIIQICALFWKVYLARFSLGTHKRQISALHTSYCDIKWYAHKSTVWFNRTPCCTLIWLWMKLEGIPDTFFMCAPHYGGLRETISPLFNALVDECQSGNREVLMKEREGEARWQCEAWPPLCSVLLSLRAACFIITQFLLDML